MRIARDTNVLSALWSREQRASEISLRLRDIGAKGALVVCAPVYVELYANPNMTPTFIDDFLAATGIAIDFALDDEVWHVAANACAAYAHRRRRSGGGTPKRLPVDFLVASHASLHADGLMTFDANLYRLDFPNLALLGL